MFGGRKHRSSPEEPEELEGEDGSDGDSEGAEVAEEDGFSRAEGPLDVSELDPDDETERVDLGSLRIPAVADLEMQLQAGEDGEIVQVVLVLADSAVELSVFAAPRSESIWEEVRGELATSVDEAEGTWTVRDGEFGVELVAALPDPEGGRQLRFVGVDGPRWFLRAVFNGQAALDPASATELHRVLRGVVVCRGTDPMPVRDALPLTLPDDLAQQAEQAQQEAEADAPGSEGGGTA